MSKRADIFERLAASSPQDATAACVMSSGEHYEPNVDFDGHWHSDCPPSMMNVRAGEDRGFIGTTYGRLTVIGIALGKWVWVVRCACGDYEFRPRVPIDSEDRCQVCRHLVKVADNYKQLGSRPINDFINPSSETFETRVTVDIVEPNPVAIVDPKHAWIMEGENAAKVAKAQSTARANVRLNAARLEKIALIATTDAKIRAASMNANEARIQARYVELNEAKRMAKRSQRKWHR
jgi:hypothetical protein